MRGSGLPGTGSALPVAGQQDDDGFCAAAAGRRGSDFTQTVAEIDAACSGTGLFTVTGHGIRGELDAAFTAARAFFELPQNRKSQVPRANRYGYVPHRHHPRAGDDARNRQRSSLTAEYLDMGLADEVDLNAVETLGCDGFASAVRAYQDSALGAAAAVLEALAAALDVPGFFSARMTEPQCRLRFLRYPHGANPAAVRPTDAPQKPTDAPQGEGPQGTGPVGGAAPVLSSAHTDYGAITLLATDGEPGLEVLLDGVWRPVVAPARSLIVQLGDMLARWTNDRYRSTPHRVVGTARRDRYSIPFFVNPDPATVVASIPSCVTEDRPCRYEPVTAGEFLMSRIDARAVAGMRP